MVHSCCQQCSFTERVDHICHEFSYTLRSPASYFETLCNVYIFENLDRNCTVILCTVHGISAGSSCISHVYYKCERLSINRLRGLVCVGVDRASDITVRSEIQKSQVHKLKARFSYFYFFSILYLPSRTFFTQSAFYTQSANSVCILHPVCSLHRPVRRSFGNR